LLLFKGAASESVVVAMLAARKAALDRLQEQYPNESEASLMGKLVAYSSILVCILGTSAIIVVVVLLLLRHVIREVKLS